MQKIFGNSFLGENVLKRLHHQPHVQNGVSIMQAYTHKVSIHIPHAGKKLAYAESTFPIVKLLLLTKRSHSHSHTHPSVQCTLTEKQQIHIKLIEQKALKWDVQLAFPFLSK